MIGDNFLRSMIDTDVYTFSVQNAVLGLFPDAMVEYRFTNRGSHKITKELFDEFMYYVNVLFPQLYLKNDEYKWMKEKLTYLKPWYFEYLKNYRFKPEEVIGSWNDGVVDIRIKGYWHSAIVWEVPLLYTMSQLFFEVVDTKWNMDGQVEKIRGKGRILSDNDCQTADMSTRRRRNFETQEMVVGELKKFPCFLGTSNPYLAMLHDVKAIGTVSHQWIVAMQALESVRHCNYYAMSNWVKVFGTSLGTYLTDTVTTDCFLKDFNPRFTNLFSATRNDSGKETIYAEKLIKHYRNNRVDPLSKTIIFSNSLNVEKAVSIRKYCDGGIKSSFGMGNHLGNDFENSPAPNMVIKLWSVNGIYVVKLSDDVGKVMGDQDAVRVTKWECCGTQLD